MHLFLFYTRHVRKRGNPTPMAPSIKHTRSVAQSTRDKALGRVLRCLAARTTDGARLLVLHLLSHKDTPARPGLRNTMYSLET